MKSSDVEYDIEKSKEFLMKQRAIIETRLRNARAWIILVSTYYVFKATLVSYPTFYMRNESTKVIEILQSVMAVIIIIGVI